MEELTNNSGVKKHFDEIIEEQKQKAYGNYKHLERTDEAFTKARKEWEDEKKKIMDENKSLKIEGAKVKATELFGTKIKERKLDDKQSKFLKSKQKGFTPEDLEALDKEVDKFMDTTLDEYKTTAKIFGQKVEEKGEKTGGTEEGAEEEGDASFIPD